MLDGAQPSYFSVPGIPHIQALVRQGTQYTNAWAGILESETPSGHATIATGSQPRQDGILSFNWANNDNIQVNLFDPNVLRHGAMDRILTESSAPTIARLTHLAYPRSKVVALSGHKYYAADALGGPEADAIMYYTGLPNGKFAPVAMPGHTPPAGVLSAPGLVAPTTRLPMGVEDHLAMKLALSTVQRMRPQVLMVNVPEFDWPLGHVNGAARDPAGVRALMQGFDHDLGVLEDAYRRAGVLDRTVFVLTADHGFAPIYHTVSKDAIRKAVADAGTSVISDTYHTASYLWVADESRAAAAAGRIAQLQSPYIQSVYFKEPVGNGYRYVRASGPDLLRARGAEAANQYLLGTFNGPNGPDLAVFFTEDAASLPDGEASWKGDHGGAAWHSQHLPLIISGPGVRKGYVSTFPAPLMDVAPTALTLLGVSPTGMQGVRLADALESSSPGMRIAQDRQLAELRPVVSSLQTESRLELDAGR